MDFAFNRLCDLHPVGNQSDGALLVSAVSPLNDDYDSYKENAKCILESTTEGGSILMRLGNDENLGRELRTYLQTDNYVKHKNDGTQTESTRRILRGVSDDNQGRRTRLVSLLAEMVAEADYFANGQALKLKATAPMAALDESLQYLVQNTFTKMGYLKRLTPEADRLKEIQSILRSNDVAQQTLALQVEDGNKQAIDDVRSYVDLSGKQNRQVILHEMIEKRYSLRPYGWPDEEVLILIARLLVLGEISLMMDGSLVSIEKAYDAITTPARRRKIIVVKRQTSDPKALQNARNLGKELFSEMGPDGEDALYDFLQKKLDGRQLALSTYKPLADTGDYPGKEELANGLFLIKKFLACEGSFKFIEQFNALKNDLLDFADNFRDLEQFYEYQKPTWDKLRREYRRFRLNQLELERDTQAASALKRMQEIQRAPSPYGLIKEAEGLINTVGTVNTALITESRKDAVVKIAGYVSELTTEVESVKGNNALKSACVAPLESLLGRVGTESSIAHITQAQAEALKEYDAAVKRIEEFAKKEAEANKEKGQIIIVKKQRVIEPAKLVKSPYLETTGDVKDFMNTLGEELDKAIANKERIQIR